MTPKSLRTIGLEQWCSVFLAGGIDGQCPIHLWAGSSRAPSGHAEWGRGSLVPVQPHGERELGLVPTWRGGRGHGMAQPQPGWVEGRCHGLAPTWLYRGKAVAWL